MTRSLRAGRKRGYRSRRHAGPCEYGLPPEAGVRATGRKLGRGAAREGDWAAFLSPMGGVGGRRAGRFTGIALLAKVEVPQRLTFDSSGVDRNPPFRLCHRRT